MRLEIEGLAAAAPLHGPAQQARSLAYLSRFLSQHEIEQYKTLYAAANNQKDALLAARLARKEARMSMAGSSKLEVKKQLREREQKITRLVRKVAAMNGKAAKRICWEHERRGLDDDERFRFDQAFFRQQLIHRHERKKARLQRQMDKEEKLAWEMYGLETKQERLDTDREEICTEQRELLDKRKGIEEMQADLDEEGEELDNDAHHTTHHWNDFLEKEARLGEAHGLCIQKTNKVKAKIQKLAEFFGTA